MDARKIKLPPVRGTGNVHRSGSDESVHPVPDAVPERPMAPDGLSETEGPRLAYARGELSLTIAHDDDRGWELLDKLLAHLASRT